jgi:hypothetical protein
VCFSQVVRFLCELSPYTAMYELNWAGDFLARRRACSTPNGWPASAALIGNSDTTAKALSWQVYFRCTGDAEFAENGKHCNVQNAAPIRAAFRSCRCHWPPESCGRRLSAAPSAGCPAGLPFWVRSVGGGSCRGLLLLANRYTAAGTSLAPY